MFGIGEGIMGVAGIGGGIAGSILGSNAAKKQIELMRQALEYQKGIDSRTYKDLTPYRAFGGNQLNELNTFLQTKHPNDYMDPGYDFRLKSGSNAIANNAAASGLLQSGDTLRALNSYGQESGSQEYNNAFGRFLGEGQFRQGLAGMGQNAAVQGGSLANAGAQNVAQISANTNAGGATRPYADLASGLGGMALSGGVNGGGGMAGLAGGLNNAFSNIFKKPTPQMSPVGPYAGGYQF